MRVQVWSFGDENNKIRTKATHPYSYDPFVTWIRKSEKNENVVADSTVYTDRLYQWDYKKHNELCMKHFGNQGQYWDDRDPKAIEAFLRDYHNNQAIVLVRITEHCNQATGYPCWQLDYKK